MENNKAIVVEDLSKCYRIGVEEHHESMASAFFHFLKSPWANYRKYRSLYKFDQLYSGKDDPGNTWMDTVKAVFGLLLLAVAIIIALALLI